MQESGRTVERSQTTLTALELKQLLLKLKDYTNVCFRFRQVGDLWQKHHMRIHAVNETSVLLLDEVSTKYYLVKLNSIVQFDLDERFQNFQAHYHYNVKPSPELE